MSYIWVSKNYQNFDIRLFNLHPEMWFEGYPVKSTQIFIRCHLKYFRVASTQIFSGLSAWQKLGQHLGKNLGRCYPKKFQVAPYKNLVRLYRIPVKSRLRLQIKWCMTTISFIGYKVQHIYNLSTVISCYFNLYWVFFFVVDENAFSFLHFTQTKLLFDDAWNKVFGKYL